MIIRCPWKYINLSLNNLLFYCHNARNNLNKRKLRVVTTMKLVATLSTFHENSHRKVWRFQVFAVTLQPINQKRHHHYENK